MKPFIKPRTATPPRTAPEPAQAAPGVSINELTILAVAGTMQDADERASYLERTCAGDDTLRRRIEERLAERKQAVTDGRAELMRPFPQLPQQAMAIVPMSGMQLTPTAPAPSKANAFPWALATLLAAAVGALAVFFVQEKTARFSAENKTTEAETARVKADSERTDALAAALDAKTVSTRTAAQASEADKQRAAALAEATKAREETDRLRKQAEDAAKAERAAKAMAETERTQSSEAQKTSTTALADTLAKLAGALIEQNRHAEAEPPARQCLELRTAQGASVWQINDARILLGAALMGRGQVADAERELLAVVAAIEPLLPQADDAGRARYTMAVKKLANLYSATGRRHEASDWRKKIER